MRNLQLNPLTRLSALQVGDRWGGVPANVFTLHISKLGGGGDFGESVTSAGVFFMEVLNCFSPVLSCFPSGFAVTGHIDVQKNSRIVVNEVLPDGLAFNEGVPWFM